MPTVAANTAKRKVATSTEARNRTVSKFQWVNRDADAAATHVREEAPMATYTPLSPCLCLMLHGKYNGVWTYQALVRNIEACRVVGGGRDKRLTHRRKTLSGRKLLYRV